ncbi:hypothetical protein ACGC1H_003417 [Rhizoctonia solani]
MECDNDSLQNYGGIEAFLARSKPFGDGGRTGHIMFGMTYVRCTTLPALACILLVHCSRGVAQYMCLYTHNHTFINYAALGLTVDAPLPNEYEFLSPFLYQQR